MQSERPRRRGVSRIAFRSRLCDLARPALRLLPRGRLTALAVLGGGDYGDPSWAHVRRRFRVSWEPRLRSFVATDLADANARWQYYAGCCNSVPQMLIERFCRPGDDYVDIGANRGYLSLLARRHVGTQGRVFAFEPNPETYAALTAHFAINGLGNCHAYNAALSDETGQLILSGPENYSERYSLRPSNGMQRSFRVSVARFDDLLELRDLRRAFIKIDVEGYEHRVLRGMGSALSREDIVLCIEVTDRWLRETGSSSADIYREMFARGFRAWKPHVEWRWGVFPRLRFESATTPAVEQHDVVFAREDLGSAR